MQERALSERAGILYSQLARRQAAARGAAPVVALSPFMLMLGIRVGQQGVCPNPTIQSQACVLQQLDKISLLSIFYRVLKRSKLLNLITTKYLKF